MNRSRATQASFKSVGADGTHWLLVVRPHDRWAILRDGMRAAVVTGNRASIDSGVRTFLSLTVAGGPRPAAYPEGPLPAAPTS